MLYQVAGILICLQLFKKPICKCFIKWQAYLFANKSLHFCADFRENPKNRGNWGSDKFVYYNLKEYTNNENK